MPSSFTAFLSMGGYAGFVWPAYGLTVLVMVVVLVVSIRMAKSREQELERIQKTRRDRKRPQAAANESSPTEDAMP